MRWWKAARISSSWAFRSRIRLADGPVIQHASEVALEKGMTLKKVLDIVGTFRTRNRNTPVVLMGYANPIERMGPEIFVDRAAEKGVDGVLVVDLPS